MTARYHLPGLFEFYELYKIFLPLMKSHRNWFYPWCDIASIYGSPADCLWGGGRAGFGEAEARDVLALMRDFGISARLSLLREEHLTDKKCNELCRLFSAEKSFDAIQNDVIVHSDLLAGYIRKKYPSLYLVSSTTKVLTEFDDFTLELNRDEFLYVVPDFRLNKNFDRLASLSQIQKDKTEFLCNECCNFGCTERKACYENVSRLNLGEYMQPHTCAQPGGEGGYKFSLAQKNPGFIGIGDIQKIYLPMGLSNFKIEGRGLGSAIILEFLLYYMTKPEHQLEVREAVYLDSMLDLF